MLRRLVSPTSVGWVLELTSVPPRLSGSTRRPRAAGTAAGQNQKKREQSWWPTLPTGRSGEQPGEGRKRKEGVGLKCPLLETPTLHLTKKEPSIRCTPASSPTGSQQENSTHPGLPHTQKRRTCERGGRVMRARLLTSQKGRVIGAIRLINSTWGVWGGGPSPTQPIR